MSASPGERRRKAPPSEESPLRAIIDHVADGIVIVSPEGLVRFANPAALALFGRSAEELLDHPFGSPLVSGERTEIDILRGKGQVVVAELRVVEMRWEGEPALLVSLRDVTDRRQAEERLQQLVQEQAARAHAEREERRARFLAEASTALDSSLDYQQVLSRLAQLVVSPHSALDGVQVGELPLRLADWCVIDVVEDEGRLVRLATAHHDPDREPLLQRLSDRFPPDWSRPYPASQVLRTGQPLLLSPVTDAELAPLTRSEEHTALLREIGIAAVIAVPLTARGETLGAITFVCSDRGYTEADLALARDLAQRAALAVANARLYRAAQAASRAKSDFLAVMSHELRTPLNGIMGYTDLLTAEVAGPITDKQREQLDRIAANSRHLLEIVEEILTYSRTEAGREEVHLARVTLSSVVEDVSAMVEPLARRKGLRFEAVPPASALSLMTDPGKLRQILLNLLSNAVKFTDQGEVRLEAWGDGSGYLVRVSDTGVGIPQEHLQHIFEPFWQVEQSKRRTAGGTGLGLSVARRLAELLGGSLRAESEVDRGSTFTLWLPQRSPGR